MFPLIGIQCRLHVVKKADVPASKKRKGVSSSSGPTVKVRHPFLRFPIEPQEELFQILRARPLIAGRCIDWAIIEQVQLADAIRALLTTEPWELFFGIIEPTYLELTMELCSTFHLQIVMTNYDDPGMVQFRLDRLTHQLSVPEFGTAPRLYTEEFKEENDLHVLNRHIYRSPSAHTVTGRRESTGVVNTHDTYFLWCMSHGHDIDLAYFIALAIQHQTKRHRKGVIFIRPYMSPQGISSRLSMRMIEKRRGTYPPQYRLAQSTEKEAYEDIPDDVPP
ncbi:hypothetical protein GOBAR_AA03643 [Gossypium barbadense]|uniref:Uncharacterized protein n=1 Tax=Gossypium barbadense TaxID=3634 RepID=A0A2P5YMV9_GOSBA|nr:hypothetical protein GOBAR_AA03643 [Gossypium barbadense]